MIGERSIAINLFCLVAIAGMGACGEDTSAVGQTAVASLSGPEGDGIGKVVFTQGPNGVLISAEVSGLTPGPHGFHIHAVGACTPDFSAAGGHFDPDDEGHGFMHGESWHPGDLPNLHAGDDGVARTDYFADRVSLAADADGSLFDADGSAIIIHAKPDSYGPEPGAGDRVACGVINRS